MLYLVYCCDHLWRCLNSFTLYVYSYRSPKSDIFKNSLIDLSLLELYPLCLFSIFTTPYQDVLAALGKELDVSKSRDLGDYLNTLRNGTPDAVTLLTHQDRMSQLDMESRGWCWRRGFLLCYLFRNDLLLFTPGLLIRSLIMLNLRWARRIVHQFQYNLYLSPQV